MRSDRVNINSLMRVAFKSGRAGFVTASPYPFLVPQAVQLGVLEDTSDPGNTLLHVPDKGGDISLFQDPRVFILKHSTDPGEMLTVSLGRTLETDLSLSDHSVGLNHAVFRRVGVRDWELEDQGSKNGTFVDDLRLIPGVPMAIESKQQLRFGRVQLHFYSSSDFFDALMAAGGV